MDDAVKLWKELNTVWLKNTDSINIQFKEELIARNDRVSSSRDAMNLGREELAHHINHYLPKLVSLFGVDEGISDLLKQRNELEKLQIMERVSAEKKRIEEELEKIQEAIDVAALSYYKANPSKSPKGNLKKLRFDKFLEFYEIMNDKFETNKLLNPVKRDFSGDDDMWNYMHNFAMDAFRARKLPESAPVEQEKKIKSPAPPPEVEKQKGIAPPAPRPADKEVVIPPPAI